MDQKENAVNVNVNVYETEEVSSRKITISKTPLLLLL